MKFKFLDHPKNLKIQAFGKNQEELFSNVALGMMTFLYPRQIEIKDHETKEKIRIKAMGIEKLLVDWLSDLLHLSDIKDICYNDFHFDKLNEDEIIATAYGRRVKAKEDIKAIIKHNLEIKQAEQGFEVTVSFDI